MLAYYVEWHVREAWRELMFADPDQAAKATRDPAAPAARSEGVLDKVARHSLDDDSPAQSFATLMAEPASIVRNSCHTPQTAETGTSFDNLTTPNTKQQGALHISISFGMNYRLAIGAASLDLMSIDPCRASSTFIRTRREAAEDR